MLRITRLVPALPCRPVVQFVGRQWLAAYRCAAYSRVAVDVGAALAGLQRRHGLGEAAAAGVLLRVLGERLPYASEVELTGLPLPAGGGGGGGGGTAPFACQLRWHLGEVLLASLGGSTRLRRLSLHYLPHHVPALLAARGGRQPGWARGPAPALERLELHAVPAAELLRHAGLLRRQPLVALSIPDAACLGEGDSAALAAALPAFSRLASLSLGGTPPPPPCPWEAAGPCLETLLGAAPAAPATSEAMEADATGAAPAHVPSAAAGASATSAAAGASLPDLRLVSAAAALPCLQVRERTDQPLSQPHWMVSGRSPLAAAARRIFLSYSFEIKTCTHQPYTLPPSPHPPPPSTPPRRRWSCR